MSPGHIGEIVGTNGALACLTPLLFGFLILVRLLFADVFSGLVEREPPLNLVCR